MASAVSSPRAMTADMSNGSKSPSTGSNVPNQMEVDGPDTNATGAQETSAGHAPTGIDHDSLDHELISDTSRVPRLPTTVPSSPQPNTTTTPTTAISAFNNTINSTAGHDVHLSVNSATSSVRSTVNSTIGQASPLETTVSSFSQPLTQHDLKHPIRRPRTSATIFQSSTDLAAHYGIPQRLPPAPSTSSRHQPSAPKQPSAPFVDFQTLSQNYLNMLNNNPVDTSVTTSTASMMTAPISAAELSAPVVPSESETLQEIAAMLGMDTAFEHPSDVTHFLGTAPPAASPEFRDMNTFDMDFMTSPIPPLEADFGTSPEETPYHDFLNTPLFEDDDILITSPLLDGMSLFPEFADNEYAEEPVATKQFNNVVEAPYTISPFSPALESFDNPHAFPSYTEPSQVSAASAPTAVAAARRQSKATGIRKGITPDSLLDETAPTQPRKYTTPSVTSKKAVPATFARKRARSTAFGDEEDELDDLPLNPTEKDLIEAKRRQNTVAARRSRKRKLEQYQNMEKSRDEEKQLKEVWKERANVLLGTLRKHGVNYPDFPEDVQRYASM